jgi:hypothetical protein
MTIRERAYRSAHRKLWDWLADNPDKDKTDWPGWSFNGGTYPYVPALCFGCEYTRGRGQCESCPCLIDRQCCGGAYARWYDADNRSTRRKYALLVRDAWPVKEEQYE